MSVSHGRWHPDPATLDHLRDMTRNIEPVNAWNAFAHLADDEVIGRVATQLAWAGYPGDTRALAEAVLDVAVDEALKAKL